MVFVKEEFLLKKIQKVENIFRDLNINLPWEEGNMRNSMEAYEGYKVIEKFNKVCS